MITAILYISPQGWIIAEVENVYYSSPVTEMDSSLIDPTKYTPTLLAGESLESCLSRRHVQMLEITTTIRDQLFNL